MTATGVNGAALLLLLICASFVSCSVAEKTVLQTGRAAVEVVWDTFGVPHIFGETQESAAYGYGYAQARDHSSTLLRFVGIARGRAAEYWGGSAFRYLDLNTWSNRLPELAEQLYVNQQAESILALEAFAAGFTRYISEHPEDIFDESLLKVLPVTALDFWKHGVRIYFSFSFAPGYRAQLEPVADPRPDTFKTRFHRDGVHYSAYVDHDVEHAPYKEFLSAFGSNGWAINSVKSDGSAKIDMNPHLPYAFFFRWYEGHIVVESEDFDMYGCGFLGLPNLQIGFNAYLGWTHTVNKIQPWTSYEIQLVGDNQYWFDGQLLTIQQVQYPIKVKQPDGSLVDEVVIVESTVHGDIAQRDGGRALAIRLAGIDRPDPIYEWQQMARSRNLNEFKDAMRILQISMFTTIVATRDGDIMHLFNGFVPKRSQGDWEFWSKPVPGNSSEYLWTELHSFDELPRVENPPSGWVQNCNEPPWTATFPLYQNGVNPSAFPAYMSAPPSMGYRPQASARLLSTSKNNLTLDEFIQLKHSTLKEYANHAVDDLIAAIALYGSGDLNLQQASRVLASWDRTYDADAAGSMLFASWSRQMVLRLEPIFVNPWSDQDPLGTPNTFTNPSGAVDALREAIQNLRLRGLSIDSAWGEIHRFPSGNRPELVFPGHGDFDTFRNVWWGGDNVLGPLGGDTFVCVAEFTRTGPRAKSLLAYGNATPYSRGARVYGHVGDQWEMFANKQLKQVLLDRREIEQQLEERYYLDYSK